MARALLVELAFAPTVVFLLTALAVSLATGLWVLLEAAIVIVAVTALAVVTVTMWCASPTRPLSERNLFWQSLTRLSSSIKGGLLALASATLGAVIASYLTPNALPQPSGDLFSMIVWPTLGIALVLGMASSATNLTRGITEQTRHGRAKALIRGIRRLSKVASLPTPVSKSASRSVAALHFSSLWYSIVLPIGLLIGFAIRLIALAA